MLTSLSTFKYFEYSNYVGIFPLACINFRITKEICMYMYVLICEFKGEVGTVKLV